MKSERYIILGLTIVIIFAIACGCSTTAPSQQTGKTGTVTGPATDAGIRIITEEFPPFNYAGADGTVTGSSTEVVNGILARLNQKAAISILPWSQGYDSALAGPRVALYSTVRTDEREPLFKWVGPVSSYEYMFYAKNGTHIPVNSLESAKKAGRIGVVKDDSRYQFLVANQFSTIDTCTTDAECLRSLLAGSTDLWLGSSENAVAIARKEGIDPTAFTAVYPVRSVPMYIAFSNDTPDSVITAWQDALDTMKSDGTFAGIQKKYGITSASSAAVPASAGALADQALTTLVEKTNGQMIAILRPYEVLQQTSEVQSGDWEKIRPLLVTLEGNDPMVWSWYAHPDGSYYTVADGLTSASIKNRSYFPGVMAGKESVGIVVVSHSTGKNAGVVAVPVVTAGVVQGVLGASVYLDPLTESLRQEIPEPFVFYAIDTEGKFALHSDTGQISRDIATIGPDTSFGKAIATIRSGDSGMVEYDDGGTHYMANFRASPLTSWKFVVAWPDDGSTTGVS